MKIRTFFYIALFNTSLILAQSGQTGTPQRVETITAHCQVSFEGTMPVIDIEYTLESINGYYRSNQQSNASKVLFYNVPCDQMMRLTIKTSLLNQRPRYHTSTFKFYYPQLNLIQQAFRKQKALEMAGDMGSFTINSTTGQITSN